MRLFSIWAGGKVGIAVLLLVAMYPMGVAYGAAQSSGEDIYVQASEAKITAGELDDREYQPWYHAWLDENAPEFLQLDSHYDPRVQQAIVSGVNSFLGVGIDIFNAGSEFGYANRAWVSPAWAAHLSRGILLAGIGGYALSLIAFGRREFA